MDEQLAELYADREKLTEAFGSGSADDLIALVASLKDQLNVFYAERDESAP